MSFTVVFEGSPRQVEGNPMTIKTPFGEVEAVGIGSAFEREEILETALLEIADGSGKAADLAQRALDEANELTKQELRRSHLTP